MAGLFIGEDFDDELTCAICLDSWVDPKEILPCRHIFCAHCVASAKCCPVCRTDIANTQLPNRALMNLALQVRVRCQKCCWRGTREESQAHLCGSGNDSGRRSSDNGSALPTASGKGCPTNYNAHNRGTPSSLGPSPPPPTVDEIFGLSQPSSACHSSPWPRLHPPTGPPLSFHNTNLNHSHGNHGVHVTPPHSGAVGPPRAAAADGGRRYDVISPEGPEPWRRYGISQEEYDQIVSLFMFFDSDESGELTRSEVGRLARWLNFASSPQDVDRIFNDMAQRGSGSLSVGEFLTWLMHNKPNPQALYGLTQSQYSTIMMQFHLHDGNQDGCLEEEEFCRLVTGLGDVPSMQTAQSLFQIVDVNRQGRIDLHTFLRFRAGKR